MQLFQCSFDIFTCLFVNFNYFIVWFLIVAHDFNKAGAEVC